MNHSIILPILALCITIFSQSHGVTAKTCVVTPLDKYLCTDDPAKARAHRWKEDPRLDVDFKSLDLGINQEIEGSFEEKEAVAEVLGEMRNYFETAVLVNPDYDSVLGRCKNRNKLCAFWTSQGECENNRSYMIENCAATCKMCLAILSK